MTTLYYNIPQIPFYNCCKPGTNCRDVYDVVRRSLPVKLGDRRWLIAEPKEQNVTMPLWPSPQGIEGGDMSLSSLCQVITRMEDFLSSAKSYCL